MNKYTISKYKNNKIAKDDWTDYSDVGLIFNNEVLTLQDYEIVEDNYIEAIKQVLERLKIEKLYIKDYTENNIKQKEKNGTIITVNECIHLVKKILRNQLTYCVFYFPKKFRLSFDFDFYIYISCNIKPNSMRKILEQYHLYC